MVAEVAIMARIIETLVEVIEEVDFVETVVFEADQTTHTLVHVRRDVTYAQKKDVGQISTLRRRGIELMMNSRGYQGTLQAPYTITF
jgi:hypothetical protein